MFLSLHNTSLDAADVVEASEKKNSHNSDKVCTQYQLCQSTVESTSKVAYDHPTRLYILVNVLARRDPYENA